VAIAAAALAIPAGAFAWGATGHRLVGAAAVEALPPELPAFLRQPAVVEEIAELSREPDRWRDAGRVHDADRDPAHFIDLDDEGKAPGGLALTALPSTRAAYEAAVGAAGAKVSETGYLPYAIADAWQQLAKDFAYWRALNAAAPRERDRARRAWLRRDLARRERLIVRDLGVLGHYVGDGSQPMHVSVHANGWGDHPNPKGYTRSRIHAPVEGDFVRTNVRPQAVRAGLAPFRPCGCAIEARIAAYLAASWRQVEPLYALEKAGGFEGTDQRATAFVTERLAAGASELRDMTVEAWRASGAMTVGYPQLKVSDVEAARADPFESLFGKD
jgi:hypothetical protein